jgi:predicted transcriptional regulator
MEQQAITFRLPADLYERLRRLAFELRIPMNTIVAEAAAERVARLEASRGETDNQ